MRIARDLITAEKHAETIEELDLSGQDLVEIPEFVWEMPALRKLNLSRNRLDVDKMQLEKLDQLQNLRLSSMEMRSLPEQLFCLENLRELRLYGNELRSLPDNLAELKKLRFLDASNCHLVNWPEALCDFSELETLDLSGNQLNQLPAALGGLKILKTLVLFGNPLCELPSQLALIPELYNVELRDTNLDEFLGEGAEDAIVAFFGRNGKRELGTNARKLYLEVLTMNVAELTKRPAKELFSALSAEDPEVRDRATDALYMGLSDPFGAENPSAICFLGDFARLKKSHVKKQIEARGIQVLAKPKGKSCVVIAGKRPGKRLDAAFAMGCPMGTEEHFLDFLASSEGKYLALGKGAESEMVANILQMLRSGNTETIGLAFGLMEGGGLPDDALSDVVAIAFFGRASVASIARSFLEKMAPQRISRFVRSQIQEFEGNGVIHQLRYKKILSRISKHPDLDRLVMLRHTLKSYHSDHIHPKDFFGFAEVLALPDTLQAEFLPEMMQHGTLTLYGMELNRFPTATTVLPGLRELNLSRNNIFEIPEEIFKMAQLQVLSISDNHIRELPESFYTLPELETLQLDGNRFHSFSDGLGRMKGLRNLILLGNPLKSLPGTFAETSRLEYLNLAQSFKNGVPESVSRISSLIALNMEDCGIEDLQPWNPTFQGLENLALPHNPMKLIPEWVGNLKSLKVLDLSHTLANRLPESLAGSCRLEYLGLPLSWNLDWEHCKAILKTLPALKRVYYDRSAAPKKISYLERGLRHLRFEGYNPKK